MEDTEESASFIFQIMPPLVFFIRQIWALRPQVIEGY